MAVIDGKIGVLLVNLGTPDSPEPKSVYRYLIQFLTDKRVIDLSWWKRQILMRGNIVPNRYKNSTHGISSSGPKMVRRLKSMVRG